MSDRGRSRVVDRRIEHLQTFYTDAVRLHLGGLSMRAIALSMGVGRKAVRAELVKVGFMRGR